MVEKNTEGNSWSSGMPGDQAVTGGKCKTGMRKGQCLVKVGPFDPINYEPKDERKLNP